MQGGRARAEVGRRLSWALGEVGSRADAAMVTMTDGVDPNLMSGSFSPMMGYIETRLLENPDKSEGRGSLDWKYIAKTSSDVRNVVLNDTERVPSVHALHKVHAAGEGEDLREWYGLRERN